MQHKKYFNKAYYKNQKKEIIENGAIDIGYNCKILDLIDPTYIIEKVQEYAFNGFIDHNTNPHLIQSMVVTDFVKESTYSEFRYCLATFFFNFDWSRYRELNHE